jgi:hypothetical protein
MRKTLPGSLLLLTCCFLFNACSKQAQGPSAKAANVNQVITESLASGQTFTFRNDGATQMTVMKAPAHSSLSAVLRESEASTPSYTYQPATNFTGYDEIQLQVLSKGGSVSGGGCNNNHGSNSSDAVVSSIVLIKLTVTQ